MQNFDDDYGFLWHKTNEGKECQTCITLSQKLKFCLFGAKEYTYLFLFIAKTAFSTMCPSKIASLN